MNISIDEKTGLDVPVNNLQKDAYKNAAKALYGSLSESLKEGKTERGLKVVKLLIHGSNEDRIGQLNELQKAVKIFETESGCCDTLSGLVSLCIGNITDSDGCNQLTSSGAVCGYENKPARAVFYETEIKYHLPKGIFGAMVGFINEYQ